MRRVRSIVVCLAATLLAPNSRAGGSAEVTPGGLDVASPSKRLSISLNYSTSSPLAYTVTYDGKQIIPESKLNLNIEQGGPFGTLRIVKSATATVDNTYPLIAGKSSSAHEHYLGTSFEFEEVAEPHRRLNLTLRAYDDCVAFRYTVPEQPGLKEFALLSEDTAFALPADAESWWLPLKNFQKPHEARYKTGKLADVPMGQLVGLPLLYHMTSGPWVAVTEANLTDYAGMYLTPAAGASGTFTAALSPLPGQTKVKVRGHAPHDSPWRVFIVGDAPGRLIESNAVLNLNEPCAIADTSWITPGKVSFLWWNGYVIAPPNTVGPLNTATLVKYVDFAADHHIPFASIDGNDHAWYGGPCAPYKGADVSMPLPELNMPAIFAHAKERGVRMRIWVNYHGLKRQIDKALAQYARWGAEGIMVDMIERDDQENVNLIRRIIEKCAALHMTVTLHNVTQPTGLERTFPNLRTSEAVLNLEFNKWDPMGSPPDHELTVPFTRMLAGPMDFHQGGFRSVTPAAFKPHNVAPEVMGTRCHQMAMYVVYEDALPMIVDYPAAYEKQEGFDFICNVPTTWDETRVIDGVVGERIAIARRKGRDWYIGSMAGRSVAETPLPLAFLPEGAAYDAETWSDDAAGGPNAARHEHRAVTSGDTLTAKMSIDGGHVVHLTPRDAR